MDKMKAIFISIGSLLSSLLGVLYLPVLLMVSCNVIDYVTGLLASGFRGERITSAKGLRGIVKKVCMWLLVVVGAIIDALLGYATETIGISNPFSFLVACIVCVWIICNELISILENISDIGIPMPGFLKKIVSYIKNQAESKVLFDDAPEGGADDESKGE
ncbi:MAG: phage holin family protein [Lachnospiraceae bacterium]